VRRSAHLGVEAIVASPVAAGKACLSDEERELGVALVEMGAGVTNVSVFAGGMLVGLKSLPMAGSTSPTTSPPPSERAAPRPSG
jgi:cell division protein FtsA